MLLTVALLGASAYVFLNRQYLLDSIHFWQYQPPAAVKTIASRAGLSDTGVFQLYAARPEVNDAQTFNSHCGRTEQSTAILGCYVNDRIYVYDVTNKQLDGIEEVTASHEMLHAVYQRMSSSEKSRIDALLEDEYKKLSTDPAFSERMAYYARTEPGERDNELHSIIGTEVASVSPELEQHYAKYFTNRGAIVALHDKYDAVFAQLETQQKKLAAQLDAMNKKIDSEISNYSTAVKAVNADISDFNQRAANDSFASQTTFNNERKTLQKRADALNTARDTLNAEIKQYNDLKDEYNSTVTQSQDLYKSIDSSLAPAPQV